jgi:hypothetical protein
MVATLTQGGPTRNYPLDLNLDRIAAVDDGTTQRLNAALRNRGCSACLTG